MPRSRKLDKYLRQKRIEAGLNQRDLGELLGYKSQFVANWERGVSSPPPHILRKLIAVLKIPETELLEILYEESMRYWQTIILPARKRISIKKKA